jgi:hypothetical protein
MKQKKHQYFNYEGKLSQYKIRASYVKYFITEYSLTETGSKYRHLLSLPKLRF